MSMFFKLAWRNLFRNKRRTFIAGTAIGIGLAALIYTDALVIGMEQNMIHSATASFLGEGQIHHTGFRETYEVELTVSQPDDVVSRLEKEEIVDRFTLRTMSLGMITSPANVASASLAGINPSTEKHLSQIDEAIIEGNYFAEYTGREIVIGSKLAEILEVGIGDRVVITATQAHTGDLSQEMFRISGVFHFNVIEMDRGMVFIRLEKAQELLGLGRDIHEIALKFTDPRYGQDKTNKFWQEYSSAGNEAETWTELLPQLEAVFAFMRFSTLFVGIILFGVVALGIINTLFMSLHERMFEFGVLRAVGTRPSGMATLVIFEAGALAVISIVLGSILALIATYIASQTGIDYTGIEFAGTTFRELLYPVMQLDQYLIFPFWVFIFTVIMGLYPALYAARMSPAGAMRKSM